MASEYMIHLSVGEKYGLEDGELAAGEKAAASSQVSDIWESCRSSCHTPFWFSSGHFILVIRHLDRLIRTIVAMARHLGFGEQDTVVKGKARFDNWVLLK